MPELPAPEIAVNGDSPTTTHLGSPKVALPDQLPPPPQLADVPARILHTATVETLIDHAEDLSSRLRVHLRRNSLLEGQIVELEQQLEQMENERQTLKAQIEILREKDRTVGEKILQAEARQKRFEEEAKLARLEGAELSLRNETLAEEAACLRQKLAEQTRFQIRRESLYRRRLERWVKPGLLARKEERRQLEQRAKLLESEVIRLQGFAQKMREEHQHQTDDAQRRLINYEKDRIRLVDQYEKRIQQLQGELQRTEGDLITTQQRAKSLDRATEDAARMANEKIFFERRAQELESRLLAETERLRGALDEVSQEAATLRVAAETARRDRETIDKARVQADQRAIRLETQIAALRQTWGEMNSRLERAEAERTALEKLNQELAMALKTERARSQIRLTDQGLDRLGFKENTASAHPGLTELERKGFGL